MRQRQLNCSMAARTVSAAVSPVPSDTTKISAHASGDGSRRSLCCACGGGEGIGFSLTRAIVARAARG
jgi:hypothetical protein